MKERLAVTFGLLTLLLTVAPSVCSAQYGPEFIQIEHKIPNTVFYPGGNSSRACLSD